MYITVCVYMYIYIYIDKVRETAISSLGKEGRANVVGIIKAHDGPSGLPGTIRPCLGSLGVYRLTGPLDQTF